MRFFGLISILITIAIAFWWFTSSPAVQTPAGPTSDAKQSYQDMLESAESAADALTR